jgi:hypothetical protein
MRMKNIQLGEKNSSYAPHINYGKSDYGGNIPKRKIKIGRNNFLLQA